MSNYPHQPPPAYGGQYYTPPAQSPQYVNYPAQYLPYQQGPPTPQSIAYANGAGFNQNQYQQYQSTLQPHQSQPPPIPFNYNQFSANGAIPSFAHAQPQTPYAVQFPSLPIGINLEYGSTPPITQGHFSDRESRQVAPVSSENIRARPWQQTPSGLDGTDEAIRRALATASANPAGFHPSRPNAVTKESTKHVETPRTIVGVDVRAGQGHHGHSDAHTSIAPLGNSQSTQNQLPDLPGLPSSRVELPSNTLSADEMIADTFQQPRQHALWYQRREEARRATSEMLHAGITMNQISQEGIDLELLHQLFPELSASTESATPVARDSRLAAFRGRASRSLESGEVSEGELRSKAPHSIVGNFITSSETEKHVGNKDASGESRPHLSPATSKPGEERKDAIARLLAAKQSSIKPSAKADAQGFGKDTSITRTTQLADMSSRAKGDSAADEQTRDEPTRRAEVKDQVQTEIIRRRLEALVAKHPTPQRSINTPPKSLASLAATHVDGAMGTTNGVDQNQDSEVRTMSKAAPDVSNQASSQSWKTFTPRSNSFYADGDEQGFVGLPGLSPVMFKPASQYESRTSLQNFAKGAMGKIGSSDRLKAGVTLVSDALEATPPPSTEMPPKVRKRAMASDFLDVDAPLPKRRAEADGAIQVVIDISEEEEGEVDAGDELASKLPASTDPIETGGRISAGQSVSTQPLLESSNRTRDMSVPGTPRRLNQIEAAMKAMKEKIAARTRTRKAMMAQELAESVSGSTGASNSGISTPHVGAQVAAPTATEAEAKSRQQQQRSLAASRSLLQEKLEAERRTHALITAHAERETREAAETTDLADRKMRLERKAALEAAIPKLDASIEATVQRLDLVRSQQDEIMQELERGRRERESLMRELGVLLASSPTKEVTGLPAQVHHVAESQDLPTLTTSKECQSEQVPRSSGQSSADLPVDRRDSPVTISSRVESQMDIVEDIDVSGSDDRNARDRSEMESLFDVKPQDKRVDQLQAGSEILSTGATSRDEMHTGSGDGDDLSIDERFSDDDNAEDIEPVPSASENEIYPESPGLSESSESTSQQKGRKIDEDAEDTDVSEARAKAFAGSNGSWQRHTVADNVEGRSDVEPGLSPDVEADLISEEASLSDDEMSSNGEYEPPEANGPVDVSGGDDDPANISQSAPPAPVTLPVEPHATAGMSVMGGQEAERAEVSRKYGEGQFRPYESPLTRFTSYRFHPKFMNDVPGGVRSLTFSHRILAGTPLCPWETSGGVCNDTTCGFQHFRDLNLTGDAILSQLSSKTDRIAPERRAQYLVGARAIVDDAQARAEKDIDSVAAAIIAYQDQFVSSKADINAPLSSADEEAEGAGPS